MKKIMLCLGIALSAAGSVGAQERTVTIDTLPIRNFDSTYVRVQHTDQGGTIVSASRAPNPNNAAIVGAAEVGGAVGGYFIAKGMMHVLENRLVNKYAKGHNDAYKVCLQGVMHQYGPTAFQRGERLQNVQSGCSGEAKETQQ